MGGERAEEPGGPPAVAAVLFDLDGTLYSQGPLRRRMALRLLGHLAASPLRGPGVLRGLGTFRRVREELRARPGTTLEERQYALPAERLGRSADWMRAVVEDWMHRRPLPLVAANARPDLLPGLERLRARGLSIGVFSDFPVARKLEALRCRHLFSLELCATDPQIDAFKPDPRGFLSACERWGLAASEVLYVGDRADVDAVGARAAGMPCALVGASGGHGPAPAGVPRFATFRELVDWILGPERPAPSG